MSLDYNATRSFTMTLAHRAVGDIRRGGFRQLRNYVDMCSSLAKRPQQKDFFAYAQKALQRTDSCYYSLVHNLLDTVDEDRLCTVGVNMGFGGLIYGASEMKKQADVDGKPFSWITAAHCGDPAAPVFRRRRARFCAAASWPAALRPANRCCCWIGTLTLPTSTTAFLITPCGAVPCRRGRPSRCSCTQESNPAAARYV